MQMTLFSNVWKFYLYSCYEHYCLINKMMNTVICICVQSHFPSTHVINGSKAAIKSVVRSEVRVNATACHAKVECVFLSIVLKFKF